MKPNLLASWCPYKMAIHTTPNDATSGFRTLVQTALGCPVFSLRVMLLRVHNATSRGPNQMSVNHPQGPGSDRRTNNAPHRTANPSRPRTNHLPPQSRSRSTSKRLSLEGDGAQ